MRDVVHWWKRPDEEFNDREERKKSIYEAEKKSLTPQ